MKSVNNRQKKPMHVVPSRRSNLDIQRVKKVTSRSRKKTF